MQRTVRLILRPTPEQSEALAQTAKCYVAVFDYVSKVGFEKHITHSFALHHETYYHVRERFPQLPANLVCSVLIVVAESLKSVSALNKNCHKVSCPTMKMRSMRLSNRLYRLMPDKISVSSVAGRLKIAYLSNPHADKWLSVADSTASANLVYRKGKFYLHVCLNVPDNAFSPNGNVIGVDLGVNRPAVTSDAQFHGERRWKEVGNRYFRLRRRLQAKGTKSAKKHLKKLSGKVQRFRRDCDHVISRKIVDSVEPGTVIAVEKLTGIRGRVRQRKGKQQRKLHEWSFNQLQCFLTYKAEEKACLVVTVDPKHTSQTCSKCGHVAKSNRKSQSVFKCKSCGYELNADLNAAVNIAAKYRVEDGKSVFDGPLSTGLSPQRLAS